MTTRECDARERLRADRERAQLAPRITKAWDAAPVSDRRDGLSNAVGLTGSQIDAKRRLHEASGRPVRVFHPPCGGSSVPATECAKLKLRWGWPARAGKLLLTFALGRVTDYDRFG